MSYLRNLFKKTSRKINNKSKSKSKSRKKSNSASFSSFINIGNSRSSKSIPPNLSRPNSLSSKSSRKKSHSNKSKPPGLTRQNSLSSKSKSRRKSKTRNNSFSLISGDDIRYPEYISNYVGEKTQRYLKYDKKIIEREKNICENIKSAQNLSDKITSYFTNHNLNINKNKSSTKFNLFPYCNEDLKGVNKIPTLNPELKSKAKNALLYIDKVNNPSIDIETKISLEKRLNLNFKIIGSDIKTSSDETIYSSENNPELFLNELNKLTKNQVIISHSGFMTKCYKYLTKMLMGNEVLKYFDNLDAIQLLINKKTNNIDDFYIRRWEHNYKIDANKELDMEKKYKKDNDLISVIIIRHCLGCHNITPGLSNKLKQTAKNVVLKNQKGYLQNAMCLDLTVQEMTEKAPYLMRILNMYGGFKNYEFGSSVIFRAIVTGALYYHVLNSIV